MKRKNKPKYIILDELEVGCKFKAFHKKLTKTDEVGIDYRIVCVDGKGIKHELLRYVPVEIVYE